MTIRDFPVFDQHLDRPADSLRRQPISPVDPFPQPGDSHQSVERGPVGPGDKEAGGVRSAVNGRHRARSGAFRPVAYWRWLDFG